MVSSTTLTPVGTPTAKAADAAPRLLRPVSYNCRAGTVPTKPTYTNVATYTSKQIGFQRKQGLMAAQGGCIPVIGDSQIDLMDVSLFSPYAVPFAAGADTAAGYITHMVDDYQAMLANCGGLVVYVTQNDITGGATLATTKTHWDKILAYLTGPLVLIAAYRLTVTTWKSDLDALNTYIAAQIVGRTRTEMITINDVVVDGSGNLLSSLTWQADGQHIVDPTSLQTLASRVADSLRRVTAP